MEKKEKLELEVFTPAQVAEILNVSVQTVHKHLKDKTMRGTKKGNRWFITNRDIELFLQPDQQSVSSK